LGWRGAAARLTGSGFDPVAIRKKFFRLAGMKERVLMPGGEIDVASSPGNGSSVHFQSDHRGRCQTVKKQKTQQAQGIAGFFLTSLNLPRLLFGAQERTRTSTPRGAWT
jgi:hypothetical protein